MVAKRKSKKTIEVIGFPMDLGADRRGVDMGPSALRIAGLASRLKQLGYDVVDRGDVNIRNKENQRIGNAKLKYLKEIVRTSEILAKKVYLAMQRGHLPLCLGGDHSMALGSIAGVAAYCRKKELELGVIWIDAHPDMNTDQTTPSGNIHGMPFAASLGMGHDSLANIMGFAPKLKPENCVQIAIRDVDLLERDNIRHAKLPVYTMSDIDKIGMHKLISQVLADLRSKVQHIHVSFDVDSVDPLIAPGVGTPVRGGLTYRESHLIMESIAESGCMSSLEVAEVNPILDDKNRSAEFVVGVIASSLGQKIY